MINIMKMHTFINITFDLIINLNGLLVTRQTDNTSPGGAPGGKSVPDSHKRCKLVHTDIRHFSRGDQRIREVIPVPDSLWKNNNYFKKIRI